MSKDQNNLVTIIGEGYFQPIADLVEGWLKRTPPAPNRVQSGFYEHGYAAAGVLLLVATFESYGSRLRYLTARKHPRTKRMPRRSSFRSFRICATKRLCKMYTSFAMCFFTITFGKLTTNGAVIPPMVLKKATKHPANADRNYGWRVNVTKHRTKALSLSVLPIRVDRTDALKVFDTIWKTLVQFEEKQPGQFAISNQRVRFRGKTILSYELRD